MIRYQKDGKVNQEDYEIMADGHGHIERVCWDHNTSKEELANALDSANAEVERLRDALETAARDLEWSGHTVATEAARQVLASPIGIEKQEKHEPT